MGLWHRWFHELPDGFEERLNLVIMASDFSFQLFQLGRQLLMACSQLTKFHEGSHDCDIRLNRPLTPKNTGQHGDALLGKGSR